MKGKKSYVAILDHICNMCMAFGCIFIYVYVCVRARAWREGVMVVVLERGKKQKGGGGGGGELWFSPLLLRRVNMTNEPRVWHD